MSESLADFSAERKRQKYPCFVCGLPELEEINSVYLEGSTSYSTIAAWLVKRKGYTPDKATEARIGEHFRKNHHVGKPE